MSLNKMFTLTIGWKSGSLKLVKKTTSIITIFALGRKVTIKLITKKLTKLQSNLEPLLRALLTLSLKKGHLKLKMAKLSFQKFLKVTKLLLFSFFTTLQFNI